MAVILADISEVWAKMASISQNVTDDEISYLELLSEQYPNQNAACKEIINLQAILNLPKGTEHFVSDVHGEFLAFDHVLKNASGAIWEYIEEVYGSSIRENEKRQLALMVCYPARMMERALKEESDVDDFYKIILLRLVRICKRASSKYTRSKVRKALPPEFAYILEELIHEDADRLHKQEYYNQIINAIVGLKRAPDFISAICQLIQRLSVDHLHVIGDIFDRGGGADKVMDVLCSYHSVDIQWGNHDIVWMGAASGSEPCICNVIRISARYNNLHTIEEGYGINLVPLATFAMEFYKDDPCLRFMPSEADAKGLRPKERGLIAKMHKAVSVIQFKTEAAVISRNHSFLMDDRRLLHKINFETKTVTVDDRECPLLDSQFPTIDPKNPYELTADEADVIEKLRHSFLNSEKLQKHARFLFNNGGMYKTHNGNLLFHGCIPMENDGELKSVEFEGKMLKGKALFDAADKAARQGFFLKPGSANAAKTRGLDVMWYLWCGEDSPLYGKNRMTTFERYFIENKETHREEKDPYYSHRNSRDVCTAILRNFGLYNENARIINGHVPVETKNGENPIKAGGKLLDIDGGFARAYQKVTGIAGYTLIYNSKGIALMAHEPFTSPDEVIENNAAVFPSASYIEYVDKRIKVEDTDKGSELGMKIERLRELVWAYEAGIIKEKK